MHIDTESPAQHRKFMHQAIALSRRKMASGAGGPFGSVIVKEGVVIARGWNRVTSSCDPTAHGEIVAIRRACKRLGAFSLEGAILYTSCEPCPMCLAAIYWARLDRVFYANTQADAAAIEFDDAFIYAELGLPIGRRKLPLIHLPDPDARAVFDEWAAKPDKVPY
jgi:guanine deaminase